MKGIPPLERNPATGPRRNRFEIWAGVLEACARTGRTQSWLLQRLSVKTSAIKDSLGFLLERGLIEKNNDSDGGDKVTYLTTARGMEALLAYYKLVNEFFGRKK
ncbi:MAG TPA: winged helix-turn-helix domain-containing protein [Candidatus Lokiarchaeia archaeon]|nr:winged helix-turn-helix domain-containing protein [Candidatus Lokiarchaeia archaeon]